MFKIVLAIFAVIACAAAKPGFLAPLAYSAPVVAAPGVVTATSSQFVARNHNGIVAPVVASPLAYSAYSAPLARVAPLAYNVPVPRPYNAPIGYASPLFHSHLASPLSYASPLLF
ncbi:hypothetical protein ACFFRR_011115 [Megaselia abdita]